MKIDTAVVLAGGLGTRLRPLTRNTPKGMIRVCGKPLLQWIIEWLHDAGVSHVVLGVTHQRDKIVEHFADGKKFGIDIQYSVHTIDGGTGEGFRLAISRYVDRDTFLAMNGDQITGLNLDDLVSFHLKSNPIATIAINHPSCPYGHLNVDDQGGISNFIEKPFCPHALCNAGIYVFDRKIVQHLPERGDVEKTVFPALAELDLLKAYVFHDFFLTINTPKDLIEAEKELGGRKNR